MLMSMISISEPMLTMSARPTETTNWVCWPAKDFGQTHYWRIDEYSNTHTDSPWRGTVWSFTVSDYAVVEDFEDYNDYQPHTIFEAWSDGYYDTANGSTKWSCPRTLSPIRKKRPR